MSNLITTETGITFQPKSLAETRFKSPRFSVIEEKIQKRFLLDLVSETFLKCGVKVNQDDLVNHTKLFMAELSMFPYITIKEIRKSFSDGYKERYGKYYGLNTKTFVQWLDYYIQNVRNDDLNTLRLPKKQVSVIDDKEKQKYINITVIKCLDHYIETNQVLGGYIVGLYDILKDDKHISPTDEEVKEFYKDAKTFIEMEIAQSKPQSYQDKQDIKQVLKDIEKKSSGKVILKAKEMLIMRYFRNLVKDEKSVIALREYYGKK